MRRPVKARYLIVGASGPVGRRLQLALGDETALATYHRTPIPGGVFFDALSTRLADMLPEPAGVTHAFLLYGMTNMDDCARDASLSGRVNVDSMCRLIDELAARDIVPVFVSSDAVFDGTQGRRTESDAAQPVLTYGRQKLAVEQYLQRRPGRSLVVRLAKVVGTRAPGDMLEDWMDSLDSGATIRCAFDQVVSPVHADDVAECLKRLASGGHTGLYHVAGPTVLTRLELLNMLLQELRRYRAPNAAIVPCRLNDLPFLEPRPLDCSMSAVKVQAAVSYRCRSMPTACAEAAALRYGAQGRTTAPGAGNG